MSEEMSTVQGITDVRLYFLNFSFHSFIFNDGLNVLFLSTEEKYGNMVNNK